MKRVLAVVLLILLAGLWTLRPAFAQGDDEPGNLIDTCVTDYDPEIDYFPDKVEFEYAEGVEVEYFNNYKIVRVLQPYPGAEEPLEYWLVQCGTPIPPADEMLERTQIIEVPAGDIIAMATSQLPQLDDLGLLDHLVGLDSFLWANTPAVRDLIDAGDLVEVGYGLEVNVELVLDTEPGLVMVSGYSPDDAPTVLMEADVPTAVNNDWLEPTLLARAEWIKFIALFYNQEARANEVFDAIVDDYEAVAALTADIPDEDRVTVLWNAYTTWGDVWNIPGQQTWVGALLADAGANYVLMDEAPDSSVPMDFETVYEAGVDAPIWVPNAFSVMTLNDLLAEDVRYADFAAVQNGMVFNDSGRLNENGGNDFWETGVAHPQLVLRDLVHIFYPDLLPDHELMFYVHLKPAE